MVWFQNNTSACIPKNNVTDECRSLVANVTECPIMEACQKLPTCDTCVPLNANVTCVWCVTLNRCASSFDHAKDIEHDLILNNAGCKLILGLSFYKYFQTFFFFFFYFPPTI
jgi:hypothetical protein